MIEEKKDPTLASLANSGRYGDSANLPQQLSFGRVDGV